MASGRARCEAGRRPGSRRMPTMSTFEQVFCQSAPWRAVTRRVVLPWAMQGLRPRGELLEIGAGSGAMAAELLGAFPDVRMTVTDYDQAMVAAASRLLAPGRRSGHASPSRRDRTALCGRPLRRRALGADAAPRRRLGASAGRSGSGPATRRRPGRRRPVGQRPDPPPPPGRRCRLSAADAPELRSTLALLPLGQVTIRPRVARFTLRFSATKQPATAG
jgi:hypothetical protein